MADTVYIVYYGDYEHIGDIEAVFETEEQVNAFRNRFAKNHPLKVIKKKFNPEFFSCPDKIPYLVCFDAQSSKPFEVYMLDGIEDCAKAGENIVERTDGFFNFYLLASSKTEAINAARSKRNEMLVQGTLISCGQHKL